MLKSPLILKKLTRLTLLLSTLMVGCLGNQNNHITYIQTSILATNRAYPPQPFGEAFNGNLNSYVQALNCTPVSYTIDSQINSVFSGTLPQFSLTHPAPGPWDFSFTGTCPDGSSSSGTISGITYQADLTSITNVYEQGDNINLTGDCYPDGATISIQNPAPTSLLPATPATCSCGSVTTGQFDCGSFNVNSAASSLPPLLVSIDPGSGAVQVDEEELNLAPTLTAQGTCDSPSILNPSFEDVSLITGLDIVTSGVSNIGQSHVNGWKTSASNQMWEYWSDGLVYGGITFNAPDGSNFVEFAQAEPSTLWQQISTTPGQWMHIGFYHGQRSLASEVVTVYMGENEPTIKNPAVENGGNSNYVNDLTRPGVELSSELATSGSYIGDFEFYSFFYQVPAGQNTTTLAFQAVGGSSPGAGNLMDLISMNAACNVYDNTVGSKDITNLFTDVDGDSLTYSATLTNSNNSPLGALSTIGLTLNSVTGVLSGTVNANFNGSQQIRISASDGAGNTNSDVYIDISSLGI